VRSSAISARPTVASCTVGIPRRREIAPSSCTIRSVSYPATATASLSRGGVGAVGCGVSTGGSSTSGAGSAGTCAAASAGGCCGSAGACGAVRPTSAAAASSRSTVQYRTWLFALRRTKPSTFHPALPSR
jgi:hypothetical protein